MHYFSGKGCFEFLESMHYCIGILIHTCPAGFGLLSLNKKYAKIQQYFGELIISSVRMPFEVCISIFPNKDINTSVSFFIKSFLLLTFRCINNFLSVTEENATYAAACNKLLLFVNLFGFLTIINPVGLCQNGTANIECA